MRCGLWERNVLHQRRGMCFAAGGGSRVAVRPTLLWQECASSSTRWEGRSFASSHWWRRHQVICQRLCILWVREDLISWGKPGAVTLHVSLPFPGAVAHAHVWAVAGSSAPLGTPVRIPGALVSSKIEENSPAKQGTQCNPLVQADRHSHLFGKDPS